MAAQGGGGGGGAGGGDSDVHFEHIFKLFLASQCHIYVSVLAENLRICKG